jgi:hypothetical protein
MIPDFNYNKRVIKELSHDAIDAEIDSLEIEFELSLSALNRSYKKHLEMLGRNVGNEFDKFQSRLQTELCQSKFQTIKAKLNAYYMLKDGFDLPIVCRGETAGRKPSVKIILEEYYGTIREYEVEVDKDDEGEGEIGDDDFAWTDDFLRTSYRLYK